MVCHCSPKHRWSVILDHSPISAARVFQSWDVLRIHGTPELHQNDAEHPIAKRHCLGGGRVEMHISQLYEAKTMVSEPCDEWLENRSSLVWHDWRIAYVLQQQLRSCDAIVLFKEMGFLSERGLRCKELHVWDQLLSRPEQACRIAFTLQDICYQRQSGWHH